MLDLVPVRSIQKASRLHRSMVQIKSPNIYLKRRIEQNFVNSPSVKIAVEGRKRIETGKRPAKKGGGEHFFHLLSMKRFIEKLKLFNTMHNMSVMVA